MIKKCPNADKFDDLVILSIMPTQWRKLENIISDNLTNQISETINGEERYQFGFLKGRILAEAVERASKQWI